MIRLSVAMLLSTMACGGGEPATAPATPPTPISVAPTPSAKPIEPSKEEAKKWTPPEPVTSEAVRRECRPMLEKLRGADDPKLSDPKELRDRLTAMSSDPPLPRESFEWCKSQALAEIDKMPPPKTPDAIAKDVLGAIARDMVMAYESEKMDVTTKNVTSHKLCPSAKPVPAKLDPTGGEWTPKEADWKDAGWQCLRFELSGPQVFQYEVKVTGNTFAIYARRGGPDGIELTLKGAVDPKTQRVTIDPKIDERKKK